MSWKNLPGWLKGGVIGIIVYMILSLLFFISDSRLSVQHPYLAIVLFLPQLPGTVLAYLFGLPVLNGNLFNEGLSLSIVPVILNAIIYFLMGALIAFKPKSRSKVKK